MFVDQLTTWITREHRRILRVKRVSRAETKAFRERAERLLNGQHIKRKDALVALAPSRSPRVKNQMSLHLFQEDAKSAAWVRKQIAAMKIPRYTSINLAPEQDRLYGRTLAKQGFNVRYEILHGDTRTALRNLRAKRNPPRTLDHLGLELKAITRNDIDEVMKLQARVSRASKAHAYFSHSKEQLAQDRQEYLRQIKTKTGLLLGVFKNKRLKGVMITGIHDDRSYGGFSFFLDKDVQGLGLTKTGYLLLLEFLAGQGVKKFYGGTSQPAIQSLGRLMERKVQFVMYVKMS